MELNPNLKAYLNLRGVTDADIKKIVNEEEVDGFKVEDVVNTHNDIQQKLFQNKFKDQLFTKDQMDAKFNTVRGTTSATLNKTFEIGLSRKDAEGTTLEDMMTKIAEKNAGKVEAAQGSNDQELKDKVKTLQTANADLVIAATDATELHTTELATAKADFDLKINTRDVDQLFSDEFSKYNFGSDNKALIPVIKKAVKDEIKAKFVIADKGELTGIDDTHAESFEGNGIYQTLSEPVEYLLKTKYNAVAKSAKLVDGDGKEILVVKGQLTAGKLANAASDLKARILEGQKNQRR